MSDSGDRDRETANTPPLSPKPPRITSLDALRGVGALLVMFWHYYLTLPIPVQTHLSWLTIFSPIRYAPAAVVIFNMLSGFVLALPYFKPEPPVYWQFLVRRVCRLYVPFAVILFVALVLYTVTGTDQQAVNGMLLRVKTTTQLGPFTLTSFGRTLLMTGLWDDTLMDPSIWTLIQEMRISIIFPILVLLCRRSWLGAAFMAACYVFVFTTRETLGHFIIFPGLPDDYVSTWVLTVYFIPCFMMGIFIARYRDRIAKFLSGVSRRRRRALWTFAIINLYFIPDFDVRQPFTEVGAGLVIMLLLSSPKLESAARASVMQWLGKISFSLYLVHLPVLFILRHLLEDRLSLGLIYALSAIMTVPAAVLSQRLIEQPAVALGKTLLRRRA